MCECMPPAHSGACPELGPGRPLPPCDLAAYIQRSASGHITESSHRAVSCRVTCNRTLQSRMNRFGCPLIACGSGRYADASL